MTSVDIKKIQAASNRLLEQVKEFEVLIDELGQVEREIKGMTQTETTIENIHSLLGQLEEELSTHRCMAESLAAAASIYKKTEDDIVSMYELERVVYSPVTIGTYPTKVTEDIRRFGTISTE
ncbi:MAG: hypothetical protein PHN80_10720 [Hespellia sp.]|nr:hypothetical protein [Hespellia sp.]